MLLVGVADSQSKGHHGITGDGIDPCDSCTAFEIIHVSLGTLKRCVLSSVVVVELVLRAEGL